MHVLILGGTSEARRLADVLAADPALRVTSSLAGRVARPRLPVGEVRIGGFGGPSGLAAWLRAHAVDALLDATHPFAERISRNAALAAAETGTPLLALRRPGWDPQDGDRWHPVPSLAAAAQALPALGTRVFLTTGRQGIAAFAHLDGLTFLARSVEPPEPPMPAATDVLLERGPFTLDGERALLRAHRIEVLVTKDSGSAATAPKLTAARELGLPVVVVQRPAAPEGVRTAPDVAGAADWVRRLDRCRARPA
ncbi:precorrin-6A/cobalt-precorrin-6A reductase [Kitasatospora sp. SolWspMP-SS2h]|uniref:cobalt-precorrin-6A reductase n=1 Tax=Kitasatospora sp. SolWspMP-SS2h TaxID=1305729 RepID=UPI000DB973D2|nr:cobalt-precorrin-6A reductase [Kitasatospora sp. SolWspMP-SS2h]RAJ46169.1 precorrin-6A/cobalt-precorrin-6A reductase [Kitasatospora sp. SolWspMP-SS2h]